MEDQGRENLLPEVARGDEDDFASSEAAAGEAVVASSPDRMAALQATAVRTRSQIQSAMAVGKQMVNFSRESSFVHSQQ